ncbi:MAG: hypothetical protein R2751_17360 [Bacteroidales bacterium]
MEVLKGVNAACHGSPGEAMGWLPCLQREEDPMKLTFLCSRTNYLDMRLCPCREFYSPAYTPENRDDPRPDHRLTLHWAQG